MLETTTRATPTVAVIGLGKLGIPIAAVLADVGFNVVGVDNREDVVEAINRRESPIYEPGVRELLQCGRLNATTNLYSATSMADVVIVVVPTPSDDTGGFSSEYVTDVCLGLAEVIRDSDVFRTIVISSTVMPKTMGECILPLLESKSGKKCGVDFGLCYSPFFVALGSVIRDFKRPSFALIGESDALSGDILERLYRCIYDEDVPIISMSFINAEICKLALNCALVTRITYANTIAQICEKVKGADSDVITQAIGLDRRIGPSFLKGGLGASGPCLPRDVAALNTFAFQVGVENEFPSMLYNINREMTMRLLGYVGNVLPHLYANIGILGLAYKPNTDVVDESPAIILAWELIAHPLVSCVFVYDPAAMENARRVLKADYCESAQQVIAASDVVLIMTAWEEFYGIEPLLDGKGVIDCWRILDRDKLSPSVKYIALGVGE